MGKPGPVPRARAFPTPIARSTRQTCPPLQTFPLCAPSTPLPGAWSRRPGQNASTRLERRAQAPGHGDVIWARPSLCVAEVDAGASRRDGGGWSGPSEAGGVRAAAPEPAPARPGAVGSSQALPQEGMGGRGGARTIEGTCSRCTDNSHRGPRGDLSPAAAATPSVPSLTAQKGGSWYVTPGVKGQRAHTHA